MEGRADVGQPSLGPLQHADSPMATSPADALPAEIPAAICDWAEPRRSVITDFEEAPTPFHMENQYRFFFFFNFFSFNFNSLFTPPVLLFCSSGKRGPPYSRVISSHSWPLSYIVPPMCIRVSSRAMTGPMPLTLEPGGI